jgi:hypothetical protein
MPTQAEIETRGGKPVRCPRCNSPSPELHPAVQHEGEVQMCQHEWHGDQPLSSPPVTK